MQPSNLPYHNLNLESEKPVEKRVAELQAVIAALSLANAKQAEQYQKAQNEAALSAEVGVALTKSNTLSGMLLGCTRALAKYLDGAIACIFVCDRAEDSMELQAIAPIDTAMDCFQPGSICHNLQPYLCNAIEGEMSLGDPQLLKQEGIVAFAKYPLIVEEQLVGTIAIFARRPLKEKTLDALASVADKMAIGIDRQQVRVALRESEARFRQLLEEQTIKLKNANKLLQQEIAERQRREERLRLLESVVVNANDAILITEAEPFDEPGPRIIYANQAFTRMTGYSLEEVFGKTPRILQGAKTDRSQLNKIRAALSKWESIRVEIINYRKDGTEFWVDLNIAPIADENGSYTHWISVQREIGDRKQIEAEIRRSLEKEKELGELKSRFASMLSHEFRTPLTTILSSAELLEHYGYKWTEQKKIEHLHRIQTSVNNMISLLNYVLVLGKAEVGKLEFKPELLDLEKLCRNLAEELQLNASERKTIIFVINCSKKRESLTNSNANVSTFCYLDIQLVRLILSNLLSNAIKYSQKNSPIYFNLFLNDKTAIFQIKDSGIGIPDEDREQLFESFYRARNVGSIPGTGLGLAVVKKCVDLHGGQIMFASKVGMGTTFRVTLPLMVDGG